MDSPLHTDGTQNTGWFLTAFTLFMVPLMVVLGFWQLSRAEEKSQLVADFARKKMRAPVQLDSVEITAITELSNLPVSLEGEFLPEKYFLLDNRMRQGKYGNEVLALFRLESGQLALVNRGWVAADASRQTLPQVEQWPGAVSLEGHIYVAPGKPYLLAEQRLNSVWPKVIQAVEMTVIKSSIDEADEHIFPYPIRLAASSSAALAVEWKQINVRAEKPQGYAVHWFKMAAVLAWVYLCRRRTA